MNRTDIETLAVYNAEKARGLAHTFEWQQKMAVLQGQFNQERYEFSVEESK